MASTMSFGQTKAAFSSFDAWRQNTTTKKMEFMKTIYETGYLEINKSRSSVIFFNERLNQKELIQFTPFQKVDNGHYLGFGKIDTQQMFTFIPENKLLLIKVNNVVLMQFNLTVSDVSNIKKELQ
jgi:hypothetical protein